MLSNGYLVLFKRYQPFPDSVHVTIAVLDDFHWHVIGIARGIHDLMDICLLWWNRDIKLPETLGWPIIQTKWFGIWIQHHRLDRRWGWLHLHSHRRRTGFRSGRLRLGNAMKGSPKIQTKGWLVTYHVYIYRKARHIELISRGNSTTAQWCVSSRPLILSGICAASPA